MVSDNPIDIGYLADQTAGDSALQHDLLVAFAAQGGSLRQIIETSSPCDDLLAALHLLKGSARAIGALRLAEQTEILERVVTRSPVEIFAAGSNEGAALLAALADACSYAATLTEPTAGAGLAKQSETR